MSLGRRKKEALQKKLNAYLHTSTVPQVTHGGERTFLIRPCKVFQGATDNTGYGVIRVDPFFMGSESGVVRAHRLAKYLVKPYPVGMQVDHLCRNRLCCEPTHLVIIGPRTHGALSKKDQATKP